MGWCSGTELAIDVWNLVRKYIPSKDKKKIAFKIYDLFCDYDADCWDGDSQLEKDAGIENEE
jgi:hypothetical protein